MNETIEQNALYEQTYGVGYRRGIEEGIEEGIASKQKEMVINMYKKGLDLSLISECTNLNLEEVNEIIKEVK